MPLNFKGTTYNTDNTKNITYRNNEVLIIDHPIHEQNLSIQTGSTQVTYNGGTFYYGVKSLTLSNKPYQVYVEGNVLTSLTYDNQSGYLTIRIYSTKANTYYTISLFSKNVLWIKPYNIYIGSSGIINYSVERTKTIEPSTTIGSLSDGDDIYYQDELSVSASVVDEENYKIIEGSYSPTFNVNSDIYIQASYAEKETFAVSGTTGTIATTIDGINYYLYRGEINIGYNRFDISIPAPHGLSYNSNTGVVSYTLYSIRANFKITTTITAWVQLLDYIPTPINEEEE